MLPAEGRDVQCSACGHVWFQTRDPIEELGETGWEETLASPAPPLSAPRAGDGFAPHPTVGQPAPRSPDPHPDPLAQEEVAEARFLTDDDLEDEDPAPSSPIEWQAAWDRAMSRNAAPEFPSEARPEAGAAQPPRAEDAPEPQSAPASDPQTDRPGDWQKEGDWQEDRPEADADGPHGAAAPTDTVYDRLEHLAERTAAAYEEAETAPLANKDPDVTTPTAAALRPDADRTSAPSSDRPSDWNDDSGAEDWDEDETSLHTPALPDSLLRRPRLDDDKLALLREEAERETRARAAEAARASGRGLEIQQDLGLPEADPPVRLHIGPRVSRPEAEIEAEETDPVLEPQTRGPRRELLPDIERINQTLSASGTARSKGELPPLEAAQAQKTGFRRGFVLALLIAAGLALLYQNAGLLGQKLPALQPVLNGFVAAVDTARLGIDQLLRRVLGS